jgi:hypothetical protein
MKTSIFQNRNKNIYRISTLKFFVASWRHPGNYKKLRKPAGRPKNFQEAPRKL